MDQIRMDLQHAFRALRRTPGFTAVAVLTLALGIASNAVIFSVVEAVLLRQLPYEKPEGLAMIWNDFGGGQSLPAVSGSDFLDYGKYAGDSAEFAAATSTRLNLSGPEGDPEQVELGRATVGLLPMLGARPILGRLFTAEESVPNGPRVVLLTYGLWKRRFAGDPAVLGSTLVLNGLPATVIGVLPESFHLVLPPEHFVLDQPALWGPVQTDLSSIARNLTGYTVFARMRPGSSFGQLQQAMDGVASRLRDEIEVHRQAGLRIRAVPLQADVVKRVRPALLVLSGVVGLVLLVACANVANLLLARATSRSRELAIRSALGAGAVRMARHVLTENLVLAACGGVLGLLLSAWGLSALLALRPASIPRMDEVRIDSGVLAFTAAASLLTAVLSGLLPILHATRLAPADALRGGVADHAAPARVRARNALVVGEIAVSVLLLVCAGLLLRSFSALQAAHPGFDGDGVVSFMLQLPESRYPDPAAIRRFDGEIERRLSALPGVTSVGTVMQLPLTGSGPQQPYAWDDESAQKWESISADWRIASPGYFQAMRMRLAVGRFFDAQDDEKHPPVLVVDTLLARSTFPGQNAVGRRLLLEFAGKREWHEIVGVVEHPRIHDLSRDLRGQIYQPELQRPFGRRAVVVRGTSDVAALARDVGAAMRALDGQLALRGLGPFNRLVDDARAGPRFVTSLGALFGALTLTMAAIGLFGLMSYSVRQRTQEIGVRMALGANERDVVGMVLRRGLRLAVPGTALGLLCAGACAPLLSAMLYGIAPLDPWTFSFVPGVLLAVAVLACWLPASRAARVDPTVALRDA